MLRNSFKKLMSAALIGVSVFASATLFSACTTSHPEVEMKLSFNDKTYTLEYKLYRKIAPSTVQHFLELVEKGYYDGLCIHDYQADSALYTGAYTYDAAVSDNNGLVEKDYFSTVSTWGLTQTVWDDEERTTPVNTVYGEFSDNGFQVTNGALKQTYGSLTMYYTPKNTYNGVVMTQRADGEGYDWKPYKYNSATSMFYISLSSSSKSNSNYCTFATLEDDSTSVLDELKDDINQYIEEEYGEEDAEFTTETTVLVDENDPYMSSAKISATYDVPKTPIIIKSIKVKSY
jgi:cyclophilin type peptidyl-prolyl cis-trans isomerase/CLD